ncbi:hypothetical protein JTE90_025648 [Oedothorax gibbosus]|uniref:Uncharacterized protein n=1 Tax=Oedothorax gibbosus TaxID=931172 RepID=A0AAV6U5X2_9ARAC|nr:hypothetical protein JTE90_025648 [Oedothorax gibbosus]
MWPVLIEINYHLTSNLYPWTTAAIVFCMYISFVLFPFTRTLMEENNRDHPGIERCADSNEIGVVEDSDEIGVVEDLNETGAGGDSNGRVVGGVSNEIRVVEDSNGTGAGENSNGIRIREGLETSINEVSSSRLGSKSSRGRLRRENNLSNRPGLIINEPKLTRSRLAYGTSS